MLTIILAIVLRHFWRKIIGLKQRLIKNSKELLMYFFHLDCITYWYSNLKKAKLKIKKNDGGHVTLGGHLGFQIFQNIFEEKHSKKIIGSDKNIWSTGIQGQTCKQWKTTIVLNITSLFIEQNIKNINRGWGARNDPSSLQASFLLPYVPCHLPPIRRR